MTCDGISCEALSYARFYQHGVRAYAQGLALNANPHDRAGRGVAHDGWKDGWLDACHAHERKSAPDGPRRSRPIRVDRFIAARNRPNA
ncbi:hypothetical protein [Methylocella sp.]|uniref:hypothetical protein n=1 Tax=Methylocella sp. TaxID=1978226 RepID=UPI0037832787